MTDDGRHARDSNDPQDGSSHGAGPGEPDEPTARVEQAGAEAAAQPGPGAGSEPSEPTTGPIPASSGRGRVRRQDETTAPREPSLAERRARERKLESDREAVRVKDARSKKNKRILIGAGATVGVVALIAVIYAASSDDEEVEARCVDDNNVVVDDSNCTQPAAQNSGYGGVGFFPIFLGGGGRQYHYNYGGGGGLGQVATGGTTTVPRDGTTVKSGTSGSTISRGGLGVSSGGSKAGGSGSSSGSSSGSGSSSSGS